VGPGGGGNAAVSVPLTVTRFDGGTGPVLVSNAIPLAPGALRPENVRNVHMLVGGADQPVYVEALRGRHPDGTLRSVLVQWRYNMTSASMPATFTVSDPRTVADLPRPAEARGVPAAAALPASPDYLVSTNLVGPTLTAAASAAVPNVAKWEENFRTWGDTHWTQTGDGWGGNFYDRAAAYYAMWARTANPVFWHRGTRMAMGYRTGYVEANNSSSAHWAQIPGLERHYRLTGDVASIDAISTIARSNGWYFNRLGPEYTDMDNRMRARIVQSMVSLWRLAATPEEAASNARTIDGMLDQVLSAQSPDGAYRVAVACGQTMNYMDGMLNDVLIDTYETYRRDARIPGAVRRSADYLWTQWRAPSHAFQYLSGNCAGVGATTDLWPALNQLIVNTFAWTHAQGAGTVYRDRADQIFGASVYNSALHISKEFNQQYVTSYNYLAYRR
jgi:hypothetical protein